MKTIFVDANVFLRFFTKDDRGQASQAERLFRRADEGAIALVTGPPVLFEVAWTLRSAYKRSPPEVLDVLSRIAGFPGLRLLDGALVETAIALARASGQEFADAYLLALAHENGADAVATFNRKHFETMGAALYPFQSPRRR